MTRGLLAKRIRYEIDDRLPDVMALRTRALDMHPDLFSSRFEPHDRTPVAIVCFHDCTESLAAVRIALFEYFAHGEYYRRRAKHPSETTAVYFERFFLEDAAVRLYSAGEHLANAIVLMRGISDSDLEPHRKSGRTSQQAIVAAFLRAQDPDSPLTHLVRTLGASRDWQFTIAYRNRWVHEQPPRIAGLGQTFQRRLRWITSADGEKHRLDVTLGDKPEYDIGTLAHHVLGANSGFIAAVEGVMNEYLAVLERYNIKLTTEGWRLGYSQGSS